MPRRDDIHKILLIGSGPIVIGQAAEFDYSGTQACKVLREEGYEVVLVNSNPATIMTDPEFADRTYIEPLLPDVLATIIERERPDALLPTLGGQTALNLAKSLHDDGTLEKFGVELIGADYDAIHRAEDREVFRQVMRDAGLRVPWSLIAESVGDAEKSLAAGDLTLPAIIRPAFTMGGMGGGAAHTETELRQVVSEGLAASPINQVLVEESVLGWGEFELELMRDKADNVIVICSIENIDPMGVHTGDSVTVAPAQTLTDALYQELRDQAITVIRAVGVETGGSNVQFGVSPETGEIVVIEMNPRVSRSSALASKATGFPIAKIAARLAVGYTLDEIPNDITRATPAAFEPSIDYVVTKIPRFAFEKFPGSAGNLTTHMKSVGEAMAIGRTFRESFAKAMRSRELDSPADLPAGDEELLERLGTASSDRFDLVLEAFRRGIGVDAVNARTAIDPWFLHELEQLATEGDGTDGLERAYKSVDTCAAEFEALTPYYYSSHDRPVGGSTIEPSEVRRGERQSVVILGSGPNRIGQGIEFDYCCVHAAMTVRESGRDAVMINCNPETVSTDYDTSDRLYFEPLTLEDVLAVIEIEKPEGVIVQFGGQTPLRLAKALEEAGVRLLGTPVDAIDLAEDRGRFGALLRRLGIAHPPYGTALSADEAGVIAEQVGFPLLVRPSYVLGGRAMEICYSTADLANYLKLHVKASPEHPLLLDRFLENAIEVDVNPESAVTKASVISHEYGHSLGLPDYYSTGSRSTYGSWTLMATDYSQNIDIIGKKELGWVIPRVLEPNTKVDATNWQDTKKDTDRIDWETPDGTPYTLQGPGVQNGEGYTAALPGRQILAPDAVPSGQHVYFSGSGNDFGCPPSGGHNLDIALPGLANVPAGTPVKLEFKSRFDIEWDFDYGFVMTTTDSGKNYTSLPSEQGYTTPATQNPNANGCQQKYGNGITGSPDSYDAGTAAVDRVLGNYGEPKFADDSYDLSAYAGKATTLRFAYATDPGLARPGWFIDDVKVTAGGQTIYSSDLETQNDTAIYNGGCNGSGLQTGQKCTDGWSYITAGEGSPAEHAYLMEMRDRSGFDAHGQNESDRGDLTFLPGMLLAYTDENHGYGNVGTDDPPAQSPLDSQPEPESEDPDLDDAAFTAASGDSSFSDSDQGHVDNYTDPSTDDGLWRFDFDCLSFAVNRLAGTEIGPETSGSYDLNGDVAFEAGKGCAQFNYGGELAVPDSGIAPTAIAQAKPVKVKIGDTVTFDGSASFDDQTAPEDLKYKWQFGDGATGKGREESHVFNAVDTYRATLTVTDAGGNEGKDKILIKAVANKKFKCKGQPATILGTQKGDKLKGSRKGDVIVGRGGNDKISGRGGKDLICGKAGADKKLSGGAKNDRIYGAGGKDKLKGGGGRDKLDGGPGKDKLSGGGGIDKINGGPGKDRCAPEEKRRVRNC